MVSLPKTKRTRAARISMAAINRSVSKSSLRRRRFCLASLLAFLIALPAVPALLLISASTAYADTPVSTPVSLHLSGWGWCLAYKDVGNVILNLEGSMIPRDNATEIADLCLTGTLSFDLSNRTDTFDLKLLGTKVRSLFFLKEVTGGVQPLIAEFEGSWLSDNTSLNPYVACEGRLAIPAPNHVAKPYVFALRTRDVDVPSREVGNYVSNIDFIIQRTTLCFDIVADRLADGGSQIKDLIGSVLTRAAVIAREVRKMGTPYLT